MVETTAFVGIDMAMIRNQGFLCFSFVLRNGFGPSTVAGALYVEHSGSMLQPIYVEGIVKNP